MGNWDTPILLNINKNILSFYFVIVLNHFKPMWQFTVCLVNAMQATVVTEGVTVGGKYADDTQTTQN